ncbi:metallophosphoesterase family protein [Bacillus sp. T33-2]|uniref:metallophosphoesterase family protein n=1 Tax=Bacillus sp. T33-2 TaxID=2054168 RepID=UPI000C768606|nr:metallophosphoesterase [Bacillus sp. T33-2]PLR98837.1 YfcE family phosphodiesterase [Bacillus sp. T33-2]
MKVIVVSDTHMPKRAKQLPGQLKQDLKTADLIIHAGDWQTIELLNELSQYAKVVGVTGNVDSPELNRLLNDREIISINGYKIGVVHGHGKGLTTEKRALQAFSGEKLDCLVFGHSHIPLLKDVNGMILFNPGSATDKRRQEKYSYGIITFGNSLEARHVLYHEKV